ncbi:MAG TPA: ABC transporter substrate-binding protein [Candidatus Acidoferrum sp.]|nr:ABC transporter substrate-binding protein [Candidatus Acidoferrum sp.]
MVASNQPGRSGGNLTIALRSEPKTLNPALASDASTLSVIYCMGADLIHINRLSQRTEPGLAKFWTSSRDGLNYTLQLRRGVRFSDGRPFNADDVVFSFQAYLDENTHSPQRDLLIVGGRPIAVEKLDDYTVRFHLAQPYAAAERLFDGFPILPGHLLEASYRSGNFAQAWGISMQPGQFAGLGPFRLKEYVAGQRLVLERNPYYWKQDSVGNHLPYLDEITFLFVSSEDAQVIRFLSGDTDVLSRFSAGNFQALERQQAGKGFHVFDLGPGLEYNFLFFNLNDLPAEKSPDLVKKQIWFRDILFRQAVSASIDRAAIVRLIYNGRAAPIATTATPGNKLWIDSAIPPAAHSPDQARQLLKAAGFSWRSDGSLVDSHGNLVEFSILTSSSNEQRAKMATLIQDDLSHVGMNVHIVLLDFEAMVGRLLDSFDYEAAISGIADGDADPNSEMNIWLSSGGMHLWHLNEKKPATSWEADLDRLMEAQLVTLNATRRKRLYDRVQEIVAEQLPLIPLVSPDVLAAAWDRVGNFQPAILDPNALWNVDSLYVR